MINNRIIPMIAAAAACLGIIGCSTFTQRAEVAQACQPPGGDPYSSACKQAKRNFKHARERAKGERAREKQAKSQRKRRGRQIEAYFEAVPEVKPRLDNYRRVCFVKSGETLDRPACEGALTALREVSPEYAEYYRACDPYDAHGAKPLLDDVECRNAVQKRDEMWARY